MSAHLPSWLADVTQILAARYDAEAVLLAGSQARGDARPASDYDLLVLVDEEHNTRQGWPLELRFEQFEGYPRPVEFVLASLAEVMAGLFAGHPGWQAISTTLYPLFDPLHFTPRIVERASACANWRQDLVTHHRHELGRARALVATGDAASAALIVARVLASAVPYGRLAPESGTPALEQALLSPSVESRIDATERLLANLG